MTFCISLAAAAGGGGGGALESAVLAPVMLSRACSLT